MSVLHKGTNTYPIQASCSTQCPESTREKSVQTLFEPLHVTINEVMKDSRIFMRFVKNASETILHELEDSDSDVFIMWNDHFGQTYTMPSSNSSRFIAKKLFNFVSDPKKLLKSNGNDGDDNRPSQIDWNASGSLLAVVHGSRDDVGLSRRPGLLELWDASETNATMCPEKPIARIEVESELSCVATHPQNSDNRIAVGSKNGKILIFDLVDNDLVLFASTKIGEYFHDAAVTSLAWHYNRMDEWILYSIGLDSKLLVWTMSNKLSHPLHGHYLQQSSGGGRSNGLLVGNSLTIFSTNDDAYLIIGCDCGHLLVSHNINDKLRTDKLKNNTIKWSSNARHVLMKIHASHRQKVVEKAENFAKMKKRKGIDCGILQEIRIPTHILYPPLPLHSSRQHHLGKIMSVECCGRNLLSSGEDGVIKIYNFICDPSDFMEATKKIDTSIQTKESTSTVAKFCSPNVVVSCCKGGKIIVYDQMISVDEPIATLFENEELDSVSFLVFNPVKRILAAARENHIVSLWKLSFEQT